ncbi:MAG: SlyX family protein [Planctomycetota bacterium]
MESRLVNIEEKIAHLERHLGELDGVVREMYDRMDGFKAQLEKIRSDLQSHQASAGDGLAPDSDQQLEDDKPPHW